MKREIFGGEREGKEKKKNNRPRKNAVWWELVSDEIIVMLVTQGLPSSFLSLPVVYVH